MSYFVLYLAYFIYKNDERRIEMISNEIKKTNDLYQKLEKKMDTLKHNREQIPLDVLKTRYQSGYQNLINEIMQLAELILHEEAFKGIVIQNCDVQPLVSIMQLVINNADYGKRAGYALIHDLDIMEFKRIVNEARITMWKLYYPYWEQMDLSEFVS